MYYNINVRFISKLNMTDNKKELSWEAPEFDYIEKEPFWFVTGVVAAIILIAFALFQGNLLFAIFILIASMVVYSWAKRRPEVITISLNENGVKIGSYSFHPWSDLEYFALLQSHEKHDKLAELVLKKKESISPFVKIHIPPDNLEVIREFTLQFLPEEEYEEPFADAIGRIVKF